jgi:hypothetical protein
LLEHHIRRDDQHCLHQASGDQHPVEWIAMMRWEPRGLQAVFNADRQQAVPEAGNPRVTNIAAA